MIQMDIRLDLETAGDVFWALQALVDYLKEKGGISPDASQTAKGMHYSWEYTCSEPSVEPSVRELPVRGKRDESPAAVIETLRRDTNDIDFLACVVCWKGSRGPGLYASSCQLRDLAWAAVFMTQHALDRD